MAAEATMREVVQRLRAENSEALKELLTFDNAFEELQQHLQNIALASHELLAAITLDSADDDLRRKAIQKRASGVVKAIDTHLGAFQQLHRGVQTWNIADARGHSNLPMSGKRPKDQ